ncbi:hypothetical protein FRB90_000279 [Tulasnella sp. 427]|nr:hypothetical protein FRB90_000279 [Tulasnella sp. 427]
MPPNFLPRILLPNLRKMDLGFLRCIQAVDVIRRLDAPRCTQATLTISRDTLQSDQAVADYCNFLCGPTAGMNVPLPATHASVGIVDRVDPTTGRLSLGYSTSNRVINFCIESSDLEIAAFQQMVKAFQDKLQNPPLTVSIVKPSTHFEQFLIHLARQNVQNIVIKSNNDSTTNIRTIFEIIGGEYNTPSTWLFESLETLTISNGFLRFREMTWLVGSRHEYLQEHSKSWLREITLINCLLQEAPSLGEGTEELAAMGVTLRCKGCKGSRPQQAI